MGEVSSISMYLLRIKTQLLFATILSLAILALLTNSSIVAAETENSKISGTVHMLTDTFQLPKNLEIQLIVLEGTKQPSSISTIADQDGNFEFIVNANEKYNYIPLLIYEGVRYLSEPQSINFSNTSENKKIYFDIYQNTSNHSSIIIKQTTITLMKLQRSDSTLTFRREDLVHQDDQYVYIGEESGHTIQIPLFADTLNASAEGEYLSEFKIKGNYLTTQMPIRPGLNKILTTHIVSYDKNKDYYLLNIKNPFPSNLVLVEIPEDFISKIEFENSDSWTTKTTEINNVPLLIFSKDMYVEQNQNTHLTLIGLSGLNSPHIFTSVSNSILAIFISVILISTIVAIFYKVIYTDEKTKP